MIHVLFEMVPFQGRHSFTPPKHPQKTNMAMEHHDSLTMEITMFNKQYIFKWLVFYCHVSFHGCTWMSRWSLVTG